MCSLERFVLLSLRLDEQGNGGRAGGWQILKKKLHVNQASVLRLPLLLK